MPNASHDSGSNPSIPPPRRRSSQANSRLARLCQKELRETLRDRRTITTLLLMPLLVYPLLSMSLNRFLINATAGTTEATPYTVGVNTDAEGEQLVRWLEDPMSQPPDAILKASRGQLAKFRVVNTMSVDSSPEEALKDNKIDVAAEVKSGHPPSVRITAYKGDVDSAGAQRVLTERLQWLRLGRAESAAMAADAEYQPPTKITVDRVGTIEKPSMLGTIVPLVLVLMTITGAVYPAIDLTAGERERGTMESLMASPVPRSYILFSKYVAVVVVALLTAMANLLAMFTTLWAGRLLPLLTGGDEFPWLAVLQILGLLVLFSGFFAALLLSLTSFARSFKEAQAYLIPIMLLSLTPGMLSLMPGVTLNGPLAIAPLINIVLLAREVLQGTAEAAPAMITILSTVGYAAAAIAVASKLFGSDAVTRTSQQSFGSLLHRPNRRSAAPSPQTAAMTLALLVPIYYLVSNVLIRIVPELSISWVLALNAIALILTFGLIPLAAVVLSRCEYRTTYRLTAPQPLVLLGAFLIGLGAWGFAHESFVLAKQLGIGGLDAERIEQTQQTLDALKIAPTWLLVGCLALAPAVIEEFCFRGFLFSAFGKILSPTKLIVTTAVIFGLFHVVTGNMLLIERFIPTTLLGLLLGWIAYRSGSVWPGVLMHLTHNGLLNLAAKYKDKLDFLGAGYSDQLHLPPMWLAVLSSTTLAGIAIVWFASRSPAEQDPSIGALEGSRRP
ncbi:ABC transporter permease subunit [Stieleria sp. TO1_6]|uniref:ABC transporter permease subunit/CPBP intramembrane protease n=1 Tax=Stieleria tagensis TaxID=2956795 RepID=UPI00209AC847|nr:ABC transporter permease subunit/CPBP intramembrane protease [Stieleria tagensis]MCO8125139.1 ABC transporter permease subunit [Stieleria tagensis]